MRNSPDGVLVSRKFRRIRSSVWGQWKSSFGRWTSDTKISASQNKKIPILLNCLSTHGIVTKNPVEWPYLKREAKSGEKRLMFLFGPLFSVLQSPLMKKDETCKWKRGKKSQEKRFFLRRKEAAQAGKASNTLVIRRGAVGIKRNCHLFLVAKVFFASFLRPHKQTKFVRHFLLWRTLGIILM